MSHSTVRRRSCTDFYGPPATRWVLLARIAGVTIHDGGTSDDTPAWSTAALVTCVRYADPSHRRAIDVEAVLEIAVDWHRQGRGNPGITACVGMSVWKRRRMRQFLSTGYMVPAFSMAVAQRSDGAVAAWASHIPQGLAATLAARGRVLVRVEDEFIQSLRSREQFLTTLLGGAGLVRLIRRPGGAELSGAHSRRKRVPAGSARPCAAVDRPGDHRTRD